MLKEITEAQNTPNEAATFGTYGADLLEVSAKELQTGFVVQTMAQDADEEGNTKDGSIYERAGFLAPIGYNTR